MNISSIVVKTKNEHLQEVIDQINAKDYCEVHFHDAEGRVIATIEGETIDDQMKRMKDILNLPFVYSANLAYSYCEDELTSAINQMKSSETVTPD